MTTPVRKYNPGFLTDEELTASFCVRQAEFDSMVEMLRECTGPSNQHQIVIGPRGSGKTSLLLRVAAEVRRDPELSRRFFPVVFAEESYEVASAGEFWLEALSRLADQAPAPDDAADLHRTLEDLRTIQEDRALGDRCLGALLDFSDREGKRLALMVENLNPMFRDMSDRDAGWRLRKILQTEPRIVLLASATSRFAEIDHPDHALYDLFRVRALQPLDTEECAVLWETVSGTRAPQTIRPLEILTGGSPRFVAIVAHFGARLSFRELMGDLLDLVDEHTEYFKGHIEALPPQERRVYLALANLWKPATTREIAERSRIETSKCSAQLTRLTERGVVRVTGGSARRKQYYLSERLYNIYYLLRRNGGPDSLIQALIRFMESFYSPSDIRDIGLGIARQAGSLHPETPSFHRTALTRLAELPALADHREELLALLPEEDSGELAAAKALFDKALELDKQGRPEEASAAYDEIVRRFRGSETAAVLGLVGRALASSLVNKGASIIGRNLLGGVNLEEDALSALAETTDQPGRGDAPTLPDLFSMHGKAGSVMDQIPDALDACDEVVRQVGESQMPNFAEPVATALLMKAAFLGVLNRLQDALATFDELMQRLGERDIPNPSKLVVVALAGRGILLGVLNRPEEALATLEEAVRRSGEIESPMILRLVAESLLNQGVLLAKLNRPEEALAALDEAVRRFEEDESPLILRLVVEGLFLKGVILGRLNRLDEALATLDEVIGRFEEGEIPMAPQLVAMTLFHKGVTLSRLGKLKEALALHEEVIRRSGKDDLPALRSLTEGALLQRAAIQLVLGRNDAAFETASQFLHERRGQPPANRWEGHLIRAKATLAKGDPTTCVQDIETILAILPELDSLPSEVLDALMTLTIELGAAHVHELILASPSANLLLPLRTALEQELGRETRVAKEVEEVARDIRRNLAKRRE